MREEASPNTGPDTEATDVVAALENNLPPVIYRDPADVRTFFQLLSSLLILVSLFVLSALGNAWQYWRRPDRIVVDRSNGRVLLINDREFGETDAVKLTPDRPQESDKKYKEELSHQTFQLCFVLPRLSEKR